MLKMARLHWEHRKVFKVCFVIFQYHEWKGLMNKTNGIVINSFTYIVVQNLGMIYI